MSRSLVQLLIIALLLAGCGRGGQAEERVAPVPTLPVAPPVFEDAHLAHGRTVWLGTCKGCHDIGVAGAPPLGAVDAWRPRIAKGRDILHHHALDGFFGPGGTMMPPRGGNDTLSDDDVKAAVDYMVAASSEPAAGAREPP